MPHPLPGAVIAFNGLPWVVYSTSKTRVRLMAVSKARGAQHRADVPIGAFALSPLAGPLLVSTHRATELPCNADYVVVGTLTNPQRLAIKTAMERHAEAQRTEAAYAARSDFTAAMPSFRSGGRRVGGAPAGV